MTGAGDIGRDNTADQPSADYQWRFLIDEKPAEVSLLDPGRELLRVQWEQLLALCIPMHGDTPVKVDGFAMRREPDRPIPVYRDDPRWTEGSS